MEQIKKKFFWHLVVIVFMIEFAIKVSPGYIGSTLQAQLQLNFTEVAFYSSLFYISYALFQLPAGILIQKYGVKKNFLSLLLIFTIGLLLTATSKSFIYLCIARTMMGIGSAITFNTLLTLALNWFEEKHFPYYVGVTNLFGTLGAISLSQLFHLSYFSKNWQSLFYLASLIIIIFLMLLIFIPPTNTEPQSDKIATRTIILEILRVKKFWFYLIIAIIMVLPIALIPEMWGSFYLESYHLIPKDKIPFLISMVYCGIAVGGPTIGLLSNRFSINTLLQAGLLFEALSTLSITLNLGNLLFIPLFFIGFFASSMLLCFTLLKEIFRNYTSVSIALFNMILTIGTTLSQPLTGMIFDLSQTHQIGYEFNSLIIFIGLLNIVVMLTYNFVKCTHNSR